MCKPCHVPANSKVTVFALLFPDFRNVHSKNLSFFILQNKISMMCICFHHYIQNLNISKERLKSIWTRKVINVMPCTGILCDQCPPPTKDSGLQS